MKNKKEFFGVLFSVLICVFLVGIAVYAGTTIIGDNVQVNGAGDATELSVMGTASISQDLWASGSFQFGAGEGQATASYSRLGSADTGHSLADADDLLVSGLLEVNDTAYFDGTVSVSNTAVAITTGGTAIAWDGSSEWMSIFLNNQETAPDASAVVMSLINNASLTNGDQITLELKNDVKTATDVDVGADDYFTTLRTRVEFKGTSTYTSGHVQAINAVLGADSGVTLSGSNLRAANFRVRLSQEPGHAEILLLENDSIDEAYVDTFINFHGGGTSSSFEFGPSNNTEAWKGATADLYDISDGDDTLEADAIIKIKIGSTYFWIPAFDAASVTNE